VKVADFGIARAISTNTITYSGSVIGSVHYFSPEHAKGTPAGAKSDLYSLGVVIYQMMTGKLPFSGESPVSVALKHLQENVEEPRKINPLIPQSVENIILRAMRKNPDSRYRSAKDMLADLETCLRPERRNEPKTMFADIDEDDVERTRVVPAIRDDSYLSRKSDKSGNSATTSIKRKWVKPTIWACVFILIVVGLLFAAQQVKRMAAPLEDIIIPNVETQDVKLAEKTLTDAGFEVKIERRTDPVVVKDIVIDQDPSSGIVKVMPELIILAVSDGPGEVVMDNYAGKLLSEALSSLKALGMDEAQVLVDFVPSDQPKDEILEQLPVSGDPFNPKTDTVHFNVAEKQEQILMPNLVGKKLDAAKSMLTVRGLSVSEGNILTRSSFEQPEGVIYKQFPYNPDDEVDPGAKDIVLYVSSGKPTDAGEAVFSLPPIPPAKEGEPSTVLIQVTDAQSENRVVLTEQIDTAKIFNVPVVVTKNKSAKVQVLRDNTLFETYTFTYEMYLNTINKPSPTATPTPTATPSLDGASTSPQVPAGGGESADPVIGATETPAQ
ncbi:MAG: PASTA domain-containing protein, partial [Gorillibacterium sp.]|nr:PASTA domain-containing protein [Gorillibacterium sp.]